MNAHFRTFSQLRQLLLVAAMTLAAMPGCGGGGGSSNTGSLGPDYIGGVSSEAVSIPAGSSPGSNEFGTVGVHIHWGYGNLNPRTIVGFNIYRDNFRENNGVGISSASESVLDGPVGPVLTAPNGQFDAVDYGQARQFTYSFADLSGNSGATTNVSGATVPLGTINTAERSVSGVAVGTAHHYYVTAIFQVTDPATGKVSTAEMPLSTGAAVGLATPILPVTVIGTGGVLINGQPVPSATNIDLSSVVVGFEPTPGANNYVIDIAPDSTYANKTTLSLAASSTGGTLLATAPIDLVSQFPGVTSFVFRIGARNSADNPGPSKNPIYTGGLSNPDLNPTGGSYIYTANASFSGA